MSFDPAQPFTFEPVAAPVFNPQEGFDTAPTGDGFDPQGSYEEQPGAWGGQLNTARRAFKQLQQGTALSSIDADLRNMDPEKGFREYLSRYRQGRGDPQTIRREGLEQWLARTNQEARTNWQTMTREGAPLAQREQERVERARTSLPARFADMARLQKQIDDIPESADVEAYNRADFPGKLLATAQNPVEIPANLVLRGAIGSVPAMTAATAGSIAGGPAGGAIGMGLGAYQQEYVGALQEALARSGTDMTDPAALQKTLLDPKFLEAARERGVKRGIPIAIFNALSAGLGGHFLALAEQAGTSTALAAAKEALTQGAVMGTGEAAAQAATGDKFNPSAVFEQVLGAVVPGLRHVLQNHLQERAAARAPSRPLAEGAGSEQTTTQQPAEAAATRRQMGDQGKTAPSAPDLAGLLDALDAEQKQTEARAANEAAAREQRQQIAADKLANLDRVLDLARQVDTDAQANHPQLQGAVRLLSGYAEDNASGGNQEQRSEILRLLSRLQPRLDEATAGLEEQRAQDRSAQQAAAAAQAAERTAALAADRANLREARKQGIGPDGQFDYDNASEQALNARAEQGDERAQDILMHRTDSEGSDTGQPDLLETLRTVKLPSEDKGGLGGELRQLIDEEMNFGQRRQYTRPGAGSLDDVVTTLRADHGFEQLQTPDDLIEATRSALRGQRITPQARSVDFNEATFTPAERTIAERAKGQFAPANDRANLEAYARLPDANEGRILNPDLARELNPDYRRDRAGSTRAIHESVSGFIERIYQHLLARPPTGEVAILAGGPASGKGTVAKGYVRDAEIVYDQTLRRADKAVQHIDAALQSGRPVHVLYVHRPVELAVQGAVNRALNPHDGRPVPLEYISQSHHGAQSTLRHLAEHYRGDDRVRFTVIDNSGRVQDATVRPESVDYLRQPGVIYDSEPRVAARVRTAYAGERHRLNPALRQAFEGVDEHVHEPAGIRPPLQGERTERGAGDTRAQAIRATGPDAGLSERQKQRIWKAFAGAFPELAHQVDVEIALNEREMARYLERVGQPGVTPERVSRLYGAMIPAEVRDRVSESRAKRDAIIFSDKTWRDFRTGARVAAHEVAHMFWYALPEQTRQVLREQHRVEVENRTGPLYQDGHLQSTIRGVESLDGVPGDHWQGTREWFSERIATLNRDWAEGRLRTADRGPLGRAELLLRDTWHEIMTWLRRVFEADVRRRLHQDPDSDFWQGEFRRFVEGGAQADERTREAGTAYAENRRGVQMAEQLDERTGPTEAPDHERGPGELHSGPPPRGGEGGPTQARDATRRALETLNDKMARGAIDADHARRLVRAFYRQHSEGERTLRPYPTWWANQWANQWGSGYRNHPERLETREEYLARIEQKTGLKSAQEADRLGAAVEHFDAGGRFEWPGGFDRTDMVRRTAYAERGPEADEALRALQGAREAERTAFTATREALEHADHDLQQINRELTELRESGEDSATIDQRGRALQARQRGAAAMREARYAAFVAARDRMQLWEDRIRLHQANAETVAQEAVRGAQQRRGADLLAEYHSLEEQMNEAAGRGNHQRIQDIKARREEIRQRLDREVPDWRERGRQTEAQTIERQPGEEEQSPFAPAEPDRTVHASKWQDIEGHGTPPEETRLSSLGRMLAHIGRGFAGALPELPVFPRAWWNKSDTFLRGRPDFYERLKQGFRLLKRSQEGVLREAARQVEHVVQPLKEAQAKSARFDANAYEELRRAQLRQRTLRENGRIVPRELTRRITELQAKFETDPYVLFSRLAMYLDFQWRKLNLKNQRGESITLPGNLNLDEVQARLADLRAKIARNPHAAAITEAVKRHVELVRNVADDLRGRELIAQEIATNNTYFPHLLADRTRPGLERVKIGTAADFRGYLLDPVGSAAPIETDYVRAMYYHMVQVGAHNQRADVVRQFFKPYDVRDQVQKLARSLSRERGYPVSWRQAYHEKFSDAGYSVFTADPHGSVIPALAIDRDKLAQRLGAAIGDGDIHEELQRLGVEGIRILPGDIREALQSGEKEFWIVPEKIAEALRGIEERESARDGLIQKALALAQKTWKGNILFAPWNWVRYEYNNLVADTEKIFSADPQMLRKFPEAARDIAALTNGSQVTDNLRRAVQLGVLDTVTANEIGSLPQIREFDFLGTDRERLLNWFRRHATTRASKWREGLFRYANFLTNLERIKAGEQPVYAGAYWRTVESIKDSAPGANDAAYYKAAEISLKTFGDYSDISATGQTLRKLMIPFYSWTEINFRYHANLFRNLRDAVSAHDISAAQAAKAGARAAAVFGFTLTRKAAGMFLLRLAVPYIAINLWNNLAQNRDIEDELSEEDKRRFHVILGRDDKGRAQVLYTQTALSDVLHWFGGPEFARLATEYIKGHTDLKTAMGDWTERLVPDFLNNVIGSAGPVYKVPVMLLTHEQFFPDVTAPRTIPKYDMRRVILGNMTDQFTADMIERLVNRDFVSDRTMGDWAMQNILQVRKRDAEQWAFYGIRDKANDFIEQRTGTSREGGSYDARDQQVLRNFRRAIYRGDVETALQMYQRLLALGYTSERFTASVRAQDPLSLLGKQGAAGNLRREFVESLNPYERAMLQRAYRFYERMASVHGEEKRLFPRAGRNEREAEILRAHFHPREDLLQTTLADRDQVDDEEIDRRAARDMQNSLRLHR